MPAATLLLAEVSIPPCNLRTISPIPWIDRSIDRSRLSIVTIHLILDLMIQPAGRLAGFLPRGHLRTSRSEQVTRSRYNEVAGRLFPRPFCPPSLPAFSPLWDVQARMTCWRKKKPELYYNNH